MNIAANPYKLINDVYKIKMWFETEIVVSKIANKNGLFFKWTNKLFKPISLSWKQEATGK